MIARSLCRRCSLSTYKENRLEDNRNYAQLLKETMDEVNTGGINTDIAPL